MTRRKVRLALAGIFLGVLVVILGGFFSGHRDFTMDPASEVIFNKAAGTARNLGWPTLSYVLITMGREAEERHLRRGIASGRVAVVRFNQPEKYDRNEFSRRIFRNGEDLETQITNATIYMIRSVPDANSPEAYEILVHPEDQERVQAYVNFLEAQERIWSFE